MRDIFLNDSRENQGDLARVALTVLLFLVH